MSSLLGVVPARGGSKRIRNKNIVDFHGKPIVAYSLQAMADSGIYDEIHVSTDSEEIAEVATQLGFPPAFMRTTHADDGAGVLDVGRWVLAQYAQRRVSFDSVGFVTACSPLVQGSDLSAGFQAFCAGGRRPQLTVSDYPAPAQQALLVSPTNEIQPVWPDLFVARSQDLPATVFDTGAFAFFQASSLANGESEQFGLYRGFRLARHKSVDINSLDDLDFARTLYSGLMAKQSVGK